MSELTIPPDAGCPSGLAPPETSLAGDLSAFAKTKDGMSTMILSVRGAKCGGCLSKIENAIRALPGVESARLNLSTGGR